MAVSTSAKFEPRVYGVKSTALTFLSGSMAGALSKAIMQPMDLIRTRLQAQDGQIVGLPKYKGLRHALRTIVRTEGAVALYTGLSANLLGSSIAWGTQIFSYNTAKSHFRNKQQTMELAPRYQMASGLFSGFCTVCVTNPIWFIKIRLQLQTKTGHKYYKGLFNCVYRTFTEEGIFAFYRGMVPALTLCSDASLRFMFYEQFRVFIVKHWHSELPPEIASRSLSLHETLLMGAVAKTLSSSITYPLQVLRNRLYQRGKEKGTGRYRGIADCVRRTFRYEGVRGFYKGIVPHLVKTAPGNALAFSFCEMFMKMFSKDW